MATTRKEALDALAAHVPVFAARVAPLYRLLGWQWHNSEIPNESRIAATALGLIQNCRDDVQVDHIGTGGLIVEVSSEEDYWTASLWFRVAVNSFDSD